MGSKLFHRGLKRCLGALGTVGLPGSSLTKSGPPATLKDLGCLKGGLSWAVSVRACLLFRRDGFWESRVRGFRGWGPVGCLCLSEAFCSLNQLQGCISIIAPKTERIFRFHCVPGA